MRKYFLSFILVFILGLSHISQARLDIISINEQGEDAVIELLISYNLGAFKASKNFTDFLEFQDERFARSGFVFHNSEILSDNKLKVVKESLDSHRYTVVTRLEKPLMKKAEGSVKIALYAKKEGATGQDSLSALDREWTIMVYMGADSNLDAAGEQDLKEMMEAGSSDKVAMVVEFDHATLPSARYYIEKDNLNKIMDVPEQNMGDPVVLVDFVKWAMENYRAKKYAFIGWSHGSGPISLAGPGSIVYDMQNNKRGGNPRISPRPSRSFGYDDTAGDCITLVEFKDALRQIKEFNGGRKLDLIAFDCCIMNTLEVAYQLRDYTDALLAAVTNFPGMGFYYTGILSGANENPNATGEGLAQIILESNKAFYDTIIQYIMENPNAIGGGDPIAFINDRFELNFSYSRIKEVDNVVQALDDLTQTLVAGMQSGESIKGALAKAREESLTYASLFGEQYGDLYVDLYCFAKNIVKYAPESYRPFANKLVEALDAFEVATYYSIDQAKDGRISIFFPSFGGFIELLSKYYQPLDFAQNSSWTEFLNVFFQE